MQIIANESLMGRMNTLLARNVLYSLAASPAHIGHLKKRLQRWWPGTDSIGDRVEVLVEAYLERGDIQRGKNGVISCVPPFVVVRDEKASVMELFGNPLVEDQLLKVMGPSVSVRYYLEGDFPYRRLESTIGSPPLGPLFECRVAVFTCLDVVDRVPLVSRLSMPAPQECPSLPATGQWEVYDPTSTSAELQNARWRPFTPAVEGGKLIRQISRDRSERRTIEYYLYAGMGRGRHIHEDEARLWQLAIDWRMNRPVPWKWVDGEGVTINGRVPTAVSTALRLLSSGQIRRHGYQITYPVPTSARDAVVSLVKRLGTKLV